MPTVACPNPINCAGVDSPVANLTAEGPDLAKCFRYAFSPTSSFVCEFDLSLCDAFAAIGADIGILCSPPPGIIDPPNPPLPVIYSSNEQSCTVDCGDSTSETYTVVAGTFVATSQASADGQAFQFACVLAQMQCLGPLPTIYTSAQQACTATCPDGGVFTFTLPAGVFSALSQAEANNIAFAFACEMAGLLCTGLPPVGFVEDAGEPRTGVQSPLWANFAQACSVACPGGGTSTYVVPGGTYLRESRTAANSVALSAACRLAQQFQVCLSSLPTNACAGDFFAEFLSATGLTAPITFSLVSGALPPGITLDSNGLLSGEPTTSGNYSFGIRATGSDGTYTQRTYTLGVVEITPSSIPDATLNTPYAAVITANGMTSPTFSVVGALPPGITLHPFSGVISGTPTSTGAFVFSVIATEGSASCQHVYDIDVTGSDCPDWSTLLWGAPVVFQGDPLSSSYALIPNSGDAAAACQTTGASTNFAALLSLQWDAFITINTSADCNCELTDFLDILDLTVGASGNVVGASVAVVRMDTLTALAASPNYHTPADNGGHTYPFLLPAGSYQVRVRVEWGIQDFTAIGFLNLTFNAGVGNV